MSQNASTVATNQEEIQEKTWNEPKSVVTLQQQKIKTTLLTIKIKERKKVMAKTPVAMKIDGYKDREVLKVTYEFEQEISRIIKNQSKADSKKPYSERRKLALEKINKNNYSDCLDLLNSNIILFDLEKIRQAKENFLEDRIKKIADEKMTSNEKRLKVLDELNSSNEFGYEEIIKINDSEQGVKQNDINSSATGSTMAQSMKSDYIKKITGEK